MTDKQEYEALIKLIQDTNLALKNRCIECYNYNKTKGECLQHGFVPASFIYTKNECKEYDFLPFK